MNQPVEHATRGIALIDALVALLVLCLGLLGAVKTQAWLRANADIARQRTEAVVLAQSEMERLRATADAPGHAGAAQAARAAFELTTTSFQGEDMLHSHAVAVRWTDRGGAPQALRLHTGTTGMSPVYSAALALPSQGRLMASRSRLPWGARMEGGDHSTFKPDNSGTHWRIDNASGLVDAVCSGSSCTAASGTLLAGHVRFSLGPRPDASQPNDRPLDLRLEVRLGDGAGGDALPCRAEVLSSPADAGVGYACLIPMQHPSVGWSGQAAIVPIGWSLDTTSSGYKVCRYSTDLDASGRIDRNEEHPARYREVRGPLLHQNYLVVRGDADCPAGDPPHNGGLASTALHQP